ncbi:hypothetical protein R1flu_017903 [Riccia fluitans]|uniref:J domain-containing protein n=1 Tax=Riccia fluitans TaxID=41844 RepID=A0ABD1ZFL2_9MARC
MSREWQQQLRCYSSLGDSLSAAYAQLGLPVTASLDEVKGAYRRLALKCHPDLNKKDGQEFVRITAAYRRILNRTEVYSNTDFGFRRHSGPAVYAQSSSASSRFTPKAAAVWGFGLAMGCTFFGAVLLWARAELVQTALHSNKGPSRVVEPTSDALKRERIHALLMEKTRARGSRNEQ